MGWLDNTSRRDAIHKEFEASVVAIYNIHSEESTRGNMPHFVSIAAMLTELHGILTARTKPAVPITTKAKIENLNRAISAQLELISTPSMIDLATGSLRMLVEILGSVLDNGPAKQSTDAATEVKSHSSSGINTPSLLFAINALKTLPRHKLRCIDRVREVLPSLSGPYIAAVSGATALGAHAQAVKEECHSFGMPVLLGAFSLGMFAVVAVYKNRPQPAPTFSPHADHQMDDADNLVGAAGGSYQNDRLGSNFRMP